MDQVPSFTIKVPEDVARQVEKGANSLEVAAYVTILKEKGAGHDFPLAIPIQLDGLELYVFKGHPTSTGWGKKPTDLIANPVFIDGPQV